MRSLSPRVALADRVYEAILAEIVDGALAPGAHIVQETIARDLNVSRQPVQQALALLKRDGVLVERVGRGLTVQPIDASSMRRHYEIRAVLDALAAELAARRAVADRKASGGIRAQGNKLLEAGAQAMAGGGIRDMVRRDVEFHRFLYEASGNPFLAATAESHWRFLRRAMADVLRRASPPPPTVWAQHRAILDAVVAGDARKAADLARAHADGASARLSGALAEESA